MLNRRLLIILCVPFFLLASCATPKTAKKSKERSPLRLLIGDGGVRIEESYSHSEVERGRATAAFNSRHEMFKESETELPGKAWIEESSEYSLRPAVKSTIECRVKVSRSELPRGPATKEESYTYQIEVLVKDGIEGGPFETVINGEGEGLILLGEYPVNNWESTENLVVNDTVVESWFYESKSNRYEIVKKMGEDLYLKKSLRFDPHLKNVSQVQYEILKGEGDQVEQQRTVLARLNCQS